MKKLRSIFKIVLFLVVLLMLTFPAQAQTTKTEFTGISTFLALLDPGVETYPDGHVRVRGLTLLYQDETSDPRTSGLDTVVVDYNMRSVGPPAFITGPMSGTFHIENAGGSWTGIWTGVRDERGFAFLQGVGHGEGGYEGLKIEITLTRMSPDPAGAFEIRGTIIDPGGE